MPAGGRPAFGRGRDRGDDSFAPRDSFSSGSRYADQAAPSQDAQAGADSYFERRCGPACAAVPLHASLLAL